MTEALRSSRTATARSAVAPAEDLPGDLVHPDEEIRRQERSTPGGPRHLRVVEPRPRWRLPSARILFVSGAGVAIVVAFGLVYLHVVMAQRQFQLDDLNTKVSQEQAHYQQLRLQVARLDSPAAIISTAEGKLGMRQPKSVTYLSPPAGSAAAGSTSGLANPPKPGKGDVVPAPPGDADWPKIKADLVGSP
jgi:cell division protein FtsL